MSRAGLPPSLARVKKLHRHSSRRVLTPLSCIASLWNLKESAPHAARVGWEHPRACDCCKEVPAAGQVNCRMKKPVHL